MTACRPALTVDSLAGLIGAMVPCHYFWRGLWDIETTEYRCANCGHLESEHRRG